MTSIIKRLLYWCFNWIIANASAKVYTSTTRVGSCLGGHDDPNLRDWYIILDIRAGGKIILLGYFQTC
jgi:hypothetical protein